MNDSNTRPEAPETPPSEPVTGKLLRDTRLAAKIEINKICSDLRVSTSVIEALEKGEYHLLPGDPYIRALLGSVGRYLNLDPHSLIAGYNKDIGTVQATPAISPYKDRAHTYTTAHKQIFVAVFIGLFVILFFIIGKLNTGENQSSKLNQGLNTAPAESLSIPQDTGIESHSLAPDSIDIKIPAETGANLVAGSISELGKDTAKIKITATSIPAPPAPALGAAPQTATLPSQASPINPSVPAAQTLPSPAPVPGPAPASPSAPGSVSSPIDANQPNFAIIKPLIDSVGIKVLRTGKEDFLTVLRMGKQMQVSIQDTIIVFISKRKSVEVTLGGKSVIPEKKRFRIYGNTLRTY